MCSVLCLRQRRRQDRQCLLIVRFTFCCVLIEVSLSEPHTSVTAFAEVVCMFAAIYCKF